MPNMPDSWLLDLIQYALAEGANVPCSVIDAETILVNWRGY